MSSTFKKEFILQGLHCANCAAKIERAVSNISGVRSVSIDFIPKKLRLEASSEKQLKKIIDESIKIINKIEPEVTVVDGNTHTTSYEKQFEKQRIIQIIRVGIGLIVYLAALFLNLSSMVEKMVFLFVYLLVGIEVLIMAIRNISEGQIFDENFLMCISTLGAFSINQFPEGTAVMLFYQIGELFQDMAVDNSRKSIVSLMDIRPDYANLKLGNKIRKVSPEKVSVGDFIIIKPGEKVPLDGMITNGKSMVDTSAITGESRPKELQANSEILSGFVNKNGVLTAKVTREYKDSTVAKILNMVQNASSRKAPAEKFITKFARYYTPVVILLAISIAVLPGLFITGIPASVWVYRALVFLVVSCPCALVISIPLSFFSGIGAASKKGILVKGSNYLEALNKVDTVVFDKTGTITKGNFRVTEIRTKGDIPKELLLEYAAYAEAYSNHPIALSILECYGKRVNHGAIQQHYEIAGCGIKARINGHRFAIGNSKLMRNESILEEVVECPGSVIYCSLDGRYVGSIIICDEIKQDAKEAIKKLKRMGIKKTILLTGDNRVISKNVAKTLGFDEVYSELLPNEKVEQLQYINLKKRTKGKTVFVGDGINDAPVLAMADIGIAMGALGADAAIEASDVVIMTDEPSKVAAAISIAKSTKIIVWENIFIALGVKAVVLMLGAVGMATMWEAVFADVGVAFIAVLNASRILGTE
ncbi:MAG: heavy metal translocating P-type ATPase [Bacillota bacterium]|nr:heavy metal translocating P-type ATPase [Bacillota bacterium]